MENVIQQLYLMIKLISGCKAIRVTKKEEVAPAILEAMDSQGPVVIECMIEEDDKVFPMVAPGAPIDDVFDQNDIQE